MKRRRLESLLEERPNAATEFGKNAAEDIRAALRSISKKENAEAAKGFLSAMHNTRTALKALVEDDREVLAMINKVADALRPIGPVLLKRR